MPIKSKTNKIYKVRNKNGLYWSPSGYAWNKAGQVWKSLTGIRSHLSYLYNDHPVGYMSSLIKAFDMTKNKPMIIEFELRECGIYDIKGNEIENPKPETIEENLENI